ncbi:MAG TPA: YggT family protein [Candidatus Paceibacterota bacterium]
MDSSFNSSSTKPLFKGTQIVWYLLSLLEILLAFRFVLKLAGANPAAGFSSSIYTLTWPFTAPFLAVFPKTVVQGSIFEWTTILAMFVYWLVGIGLVRLLVMSKTISTPEAAVKLNNEEK